MSEDTVVRRPPVRYHGGKWKIAPWIISKFPAHTCYVEPFAGGAGVLLRKERSKCEVLNDLDGDVINFWTQLRERTQDLVRAVDLTPFSREELKLAQEDSEDPLERARRFLVRSWQGRAGPTCQTSSGWRFTTGQSRGNVPASDWMKVEQILAAAKRLKAVQLENDDALRVVSRFDGPRTLFYVDPPYVGEARTRRWAGKAYQEESSEDLHVKLADVLGKIKGMAVVSGYRTPLYDKLYAGWTRLDHLTGTNGGNSRVECIWIRST